MSFHKRASSFSYKTLFIILVFVLIPIVLLVRINQKRASIKAASWPVTAGEWLKRKQLTLVNNSGQTLEANTTYSLTLNTKALFDSGDLQSGCQDIRLYYQPDDSTISKLSYYIETPANLTCATSTTTVIHFPLQANLANSGNSPNYYLYYKNSSAVSESSIDGLNIGSKQATFYCGFKGNTTCATTTGTTTPTTSSGAIRYSASQSALSFDGNGDYVNLGSPSSLDDLLNGKKVTFESWTFLDNKKSCHEYWFSTQRASNSAGWWSYWGCGTESGAFNIYCSNQNASSTPSQTLPQNQWFHYAVTYNDTGDRKIHIYVNGSEVSYTTQNACQGTVNDYSAYNQLIWGNEWGSGSANKGFLDEFRISSTVRYTQNFTPQTSPFVRDEFTKLLLHFDENGNDPRNTGKAIDDSGNANHGTITGAKYVSGLTGIDSSTLDSGTMPIQPYASNNGIFLEEATTNKITNPGFEHTTYNTGWSIGAGVTASVNTTSPYYKFGSKSLKLIATSDTDITTTIDPNSTAVHYLYAYVYNGTSGAVGGTVNNTVAQIVWEGVGQTSTSYTDMGGGWWRIKYSTNTTDLNNDYGIKVLSGKTIYVDGFQLSQNKINHVDHVILDTYVDGSLGVGYSWSGTANESSSNRVDSDLRYPATNHISPSSGTLSFWIKPDQYLNTNSEFRILQIGGNSGSQNGSLELIQGGGPWNTRFQIRNSSSTTYTISKSGIYSAGTWRHIALVWNENDMRFYSDGASQGTPITSATMPSSWFSDQIVFGPSFLTGYTFSNFKTYSSALSAEEVADLYYSGLGSHQQQSGFTERFTDGEPSTSHWKLDENTGSVISDSIGINHGSLATGDSAPTWATGSSCVVNSCLNFNGTGSYASVNSNITGLKSLSFWVKPSTSSTPLFDLNGIQTIILNNNILQTNNLSSPSIYVNGVATSAVPSDTWSQVLITSSTSFGLSSLKIGQSGTSFYSGYLDEIKVFPYVLSSSEVKKEINLGSAVIIGQQSETDQITPLKSKLVAHWKFDEGYGDIVHDSSGNGKNATLGSGTAKPAWTNDGRVGKAMSFDGAANPDGDYATANISNAIKSNSGSFSISAWINKKGNTGNSVIAAKFGYHGGFNPSGGISCNVANSTNQNFSVTYATSLNQWNHYVCQYDSENAKVILFVNGKKYNETDFSGSTLFNYSDIFYIGGNGGNYAANVQLDELKIYNTAISEDEVKLDYNRGAATVMGSVSSGTGNTAPANAASQEYCVPGSSDPCAPPVTEWKFDEGVGTTTFDASGNSNHAVFGSGSSAPTWTTGKFGKALSFTDTDIITNDTVTYGDNFSFQAWINPTNLSPVETYGRTIAASSPNSGVYYPIWILINNSQIRVYAYQQSTSVYHTSTYNNIQTNNWYHIAVTATKNTAGAKLYINGQLDSTFTPGNQAPNNYLSIGDLRTGRGIDFQGKIDQIKLYNYIRTPAQIAWDYNRGKPAGHWKIDECQGTTINDSSGNNNHGTLSVGASGSQSTTGTCNTSGAWYNGASGKTNSSLNLDGTDDYITTSTLQNFSTNALPWTATLWFKPKTAINANLYENIALSWGSHGATRQSSQILIRENNLSWESYGVSCSTITGTFLNQWNHLAVTYNASTINFYLNGIPSATSCSAGSLLIPQSSLRIGSGISSVNRTYSGQIDDVQIYNYSLTPEQIKIIQNNGSLNFR